MLGADKQPILYGPLRRQAAAEERRAHRHKYSVLNPNTPRNSRGGGAASPAGQPGVSPIKRKKRGPKSQGEKRWHQMQRGFEHEDLAKSGVIDRSTFINLLSSFKLKIDSEELLRLQSRYGRPGTDGIHYPSFMRDMRKMMISERTKNQTPQKKAAAAAAAAASKSPAQNKREAAARTAQRGMDESSALLLDLITRQWRQLSFSFSQHDKTRKGLLDMRTLMGIMSKADPRVGGLVPFLVPKLRQTYGGGVSSAGLINYKQMIRDHLHMAGHGNNGDATATRPRTTTTTTMRSPPASSAAMTRSPFAASQSMSATMMTTGRASDSLHRPMTWRLKDSLSRTHKANAVIGRVRLQLGSRRHRKAVQTTFQMRDPMHTNFVEKGLLRSLFARLGVKVSAADVKALSFCFEVPKRPHLFNYTDFFRVVERGF